MTELGLVKWYVKSEMKKGIKGIEGEEVNREQ